MGIADEIKIREIKINKNLIKAGKLMIIEWTKLIRSDFFRPG
jgi:hypothetical protein